MRFKSATNPQHFPLPTMRIQNLGKRFTENLWLFIVAGLFLLPTLSILKLVIFPDQTINYREDDVASIWKHLFETTLPTYIRNSFALVLLTGTYTLIIGVATAWIVSHYHIYTRRILTWALILPFSIPTYIAAYIYTDLLDYSGPVQILLRELLAAEGVGDYYFPAVRSLGGAGIIMSLSLYPYVYLLARKSFYEHSASLSRAQSLMGLNNIRGFFKISLPMARPAISVGVILVVLETLNDFGAVEYLSVNTLSLGVYNLWLNLNDLTSATRLAFFTLVVICTLIYLEHASRTAQEQFQREASFYDPPLRHPKPIVKLLLSAFCWLPVILGFIIPFSVLGFYAVRNVSSFLEDDFITYLGNSLALSLWAATVSTVLAVSVAYIERSRKHLLAKGLTQFINLGYAIPGTILAIGIMIPFGTFDNWFDRKMEYFFNIRTGLLLSGTGGAIIFAYVLRFSSISLGATRSTLKKISRNIDHAGRLFGYNERQIFTRIHLPLLKKSMLTGFLIILIDSMKELSATIILRPFDFETLATHIYAFASDELIEEAAPACLLLVLVGLIPIFLITKVLTRPTPTQKEQPVSPY